MTEPSSPPPPRPVVICGPSGVGKGTLIELLQKKFPNGKFGFSVSHTTRKPRDGEENGVHYNFSTLDAMKGEIDEGKFVEYAEVHGNYYGTSVESVQSVQSNNLICLLDIDIQGAQNVKKSTLDAYYLFIAPPSMAELEKRLRGRGTESEEAMLKRLANAQGELDYGTEDNFDCVLVNEDLEGTFESMVGVMRGWFPALLDVEEKKEAGVVLGSPKKAASADGEVIPSPVVDPLSFPQTNEGLAALLATIDADCPLDSYIQSELNYQASNVNIAAGKTLDIPLPPVENDGSKIDWTVTLVDKYDEQLDIEFGLVCIVDGEEVVAREMGRILSPVSDENGATASTKTEEKVSAKGKFTVANSAPVTVIIKLDNSHAWIKPKMINYSFTITSPVDVNMVQRSLRAKSVMHLIEEGKREVGEKKAIEDDRVEALCRIEHEMEEKMGGLTKQIDDDKKSIEAIRERAIEAEEQAKLKATKIKETITSVKKEEQSISECTSAIRTLEAECTRLKQKWEELKVERAVREEEKVKLETEAEREKEERMKLQEEIAFKKEEEVAKRKEAEIVERERGLMQDNLNDLEKEKKARQVEGGKYEAELSFLQRLMDGVKLRFVETSKKS